MDRRCFCSENASKNISGVASSGNFGFWKLSVQLLLKALYLIVDAYPPPSVPVFVHREAWLSQILTAMQNHIHRLGRVSRRLGKISEEFCNLSDCR
jgi:hypothetical protein